MDVSFTQYDESDFKELNLDFFGIVEELQMPLDEVLFIPETVTGFVVSYDDVNKLSQGHLSMRLMAFFLNYLQIKAKTVSKFLMAMSKQSVELVDVVNTELFSKMKQGEVMSYYLVIYLDDRWVGAVYFIKTQMLEILDLQQSRTKDSLRKTIDSIFKKVDIPKYTVKNVVYVSQDDKLTNGGIYILHYFYQTFYKVQPYVKLNAQEKISFKQKLLWILYRMDKSLNVDYPPLPLIKDYAEAALKNFKVSPNLNPLIQPDQTGVPVNAADFELLQKQGKSQPHMMAFWLSYLYYLDMQQAQPILPFFVIADKTEVLSDFEGIFKPRRRKNIEHQKLIVVSFINNRWIFCVYDMMVKKQLDIVDLQYKGITKDQLKDNFVTIVGGLVEYNENGQLNYITQTYTDSADGTEYVINALWMYISGTALDKVKFGWSEKKSLRNKLIWVLVKMQDPQLRLSQQTIQSDRKIRIQKQSSVISQQHKSFKKTIIGTGKISGTPTQQNLLSPSYSPSSKGFTSPKKPTTISQFKQRKISEDEMGSQTSIKIQQPPKRFGARKQLSEASNNTPNRTMEKVNTSVAPKIRLSKVEDEPILETQRSEDLDEEDYEQLFQKKTTIKQPEQQQFDGDPLERIQRDLQQYYHNLINTALVEPETDKLNEINRLNRKIQEFIHKSNKVELDDVLFGLNLTKQQNTSQVYNSQLVNYSTVIHDDQNMMRMLHEMMDQENQEDTINQSLLKRRNYVHDKIDSFQVDKPSFMQYDFPLSQSVSLPAIKQNKIAKSDLFQKSNIAAFRYGIKIEVPLIQKFLKEAKMPNIIMNFLLHFIQEKANHKKRLNQYNTNVKLFPVEFYTILCNNMLHTTQRINYFEANRFTFEQTGQGQTIFDVFDWLLIPIAELPNEYSLVAINLPRRQCYCYLLSSLVLRVRDPLFINAEKNPYLRNVVSFLQHEFEIKCRRPRDELGRFVLQFGMVNDSNNFGYSINYDFSGIYLLYIVIHIMKHGSNEEIKVQDHEASTLRKVFHDLVVRIGYNIDDNIFHLLEDIKWPF